MKSPLFLVMLTIGVASGIVLTDEMKAKRSSAEDALRAQIRKTLWTEKEIAASDFKDHYFAVTFEKDSDKVALESMAQNIEEAGFKIRHKLNRVVNMLAIAAPSTEKADSLKHLVDSKSTELGLKQRFKLASDGICMVTTELVDVDLWNLDRVNQKKLPLDDDMSYVSSGIGTNIFILDTGIDYEHQEFASNSGGNIWDFQDSTPDADNDVYGHGTHTAGIAAGANVGIAPDANVYGVKVLGDEGWGYWSDVIAGIEYVVDLYEGADSTYAGVNSVISMSLGGSTYTAVDDAVEAAVLAGVMVVSSAGNGYLGDACGSSPAGEYYSLTVGATDSSDNVAYFSSTGSCVNTFAPGLSIDSACNSNTEGSWGCGDNDSYVALSGTSMSAPLTAGLAALYWEAYPSETNKRIAKAIVGRSFEGQLDTSGSYSGTPNLIINGRDA